MIKIVLKHTSYFKIMIYFLHIFYWHAHNDDDYSKKKKKEIFPDCGETEDVRISSIGPTQYTKKELGFET